MSKICRRRAFRSDTMHLSEHGGILLVASAKGSRALSLRLNTLLSWSDTGFMGVPQM